MAPTDRFSSIAPRSQKPKKSGVVAKRDTSLGDFAHRNKRTGVELGESFKEKRVVFTPKDRTNHTHIIGSTGTGKSKFMEYLIRQDLQDRKAGLCLIDPHGSLYDEVLQYLSHRHPRLAERVILFNPSGETEHIVGFNPIPEEIELDYTLDTLISACLKAWGQDRPDLTPRISKWLENIFYPLIVNQLTLVESAPLLSTQMSEGRQVLLREVHSDTVLNDWQMFEQSTQTQRQTLIEGAANRLRKFLRNDVIRHILGQQKHTLNFSQIMDEGKIVLINLSGGTKISHENTKLLGILLVNEIFRSAKLRNPLDSRLKPFRLYIDEFGQFITRDIARALEEARKYKLFLTLAHQHLAQLHSEDEYLYASVLTNCKNKVVFGGLSKEDAEIMTDEISTGFVNLKSIKDEMYATKIRHTEETRTVHTHSHGQTSGKSESQSTGVAEAHGTSQTDGTARGHSETETTGSSETRGRSQTQSTTTTSGATTGHSDTTGSSESASTGMNASQSEGRSHNDQFSETQGSSLTDSENSTHSNNWSNGRSENRGQSTSQAFSENKPIGTSVTDMGRKGYSNTTGRNQGNSTSSSQGGSNSQGESHSETQSKSSTKGYSDGTNHNHTQGQTQTQGQSHNQSHSTQHSEQHSESSGISQGTSQSHGRSESHATGQQFSQSKQQGKSHTITTNQNSTSGKSRSESSGESTAKVPFLKPEQYQELTSRTFWTKDELHYMEMATIKNQGIAEAFIRIGNQPPVRTKIDHVKAIPYNPRFSPGKLEQFRANSFTAHAEYCLPIIEARRVSAQRQTAFFGAPLQFDEQLPIATLDALPAPSGDDESFDPFT